MFLPRVSLSVERSLGRGLEAGKSSGLHSSVGPRLFYQLEDLGGNPDCQEDNPSDEQDQDEVLFGKWLSFVTPGLHSTSSFFGRIGFRLETPCARLRLAALPLPSACNDGHAGQQVTDSAWPPKVRRVT